MWQKQTKATGPETVKNAESKTENHGRLRSSELQVLDDKLVSSEPDVSRCGEVSLLITVHDPPHLPLPAPPAL